MKNKIVLSGQGFTAHYGRYSVEVSKVLSYTMDEQSTNTRHSHSEYEFNLVVSGTGQYYHEDYIFNLKRGDVFISDPFLTHEINSITTKDLHFLWINI